MKFIHTANADRGIRELAAKIIELLNDSKSVLWLIAGGSNVPIAKRVMDAVRMECAPKELARLTVSQTDERYGPVGHADSNWKQMLDAGFDTSVVKSMPILRDMPVEETVAAWGPAIFEVIEAADAVIGQFGMGADGHIAGMLPHSPTIHDHAPASCHTDQNFTRITLTSHPLELMTSAYAFVFGESKHEALRNLHDKNLSLDEEPAQILKKLGDATLYTDCTL